MALGTVKRDLVLAGIPQHLIGLRHSKSDAEVKKLAEQWGDVALTPMLQDTGEVDSPVMLVCHARIRSAKNFPSFCAFQGEKRSLLIWDESLMTTDADALSLLDVEYGLGRVSSALGNQPELRTALDEMRQNISGEIERQRAGCEPSKSFLLTSAEVGQLQKEINHLPAFRGPVWQASLATTKAILRLAELPVSIAMTGNGTSGDGIIHYRVAVDPLLENIAILDASHTVRVLAQEPSIQDGTTNAMRTCKRYANVRVIENRVASGKTTLMGQREKGIAIAALAADYLRSIPADERVLFFTHKGDDRKALQRQMQADLTAQGIDLTERVAGHLRINWLTWGNETSLNTMSECKHVILCGITRRNPLELAASMAGQQGDLYYRMEAHEAKKLLVSEMAHCVLQAMSRGTCRRVDGCGQALPMALTIFGGVDGLAEALSSSLPDVAWRIEQPDGPTSRTALAARRIAQYLKEAPRETQSVSVMKLKADLALPLGPDCFREAVNIAMIMAVLDSLRGGCRWVRRGRSVARAPTAA